MTRSTSEPEAIETDTVVTVVTEAFAGLFGEFEQPPVLATPTPGQLPSAATVSISGGWSGQVRLECSEELSVRAAADLFLVPPEQLSPDDIGDALGELTNIIGGTIKSLLPGPSTLSLPAVRRNLTTAEQPDSAPELSRVQFSWHEQPIRITVSTS